MLTLVPPLASELPDLDDEVWCRVRWCFHPAMWRLEVDCETAHGTWVRPICDPCWTEVQTTELFLTCSICTQEGGYTKLSIGACTRL